MPQQFRKPPKVDVVKARRIKALREGLKSGHRLTQEQIARLMGVPKFTYQKWEQRGQISPNHILAFCHVVGCTPQYYLGGID